MWTEEDEMWRMRWIESAGRGACVAGSMREVIFGNIVVSFVAEYPKVDGG